MSFLQDNFNENINVFAEICRSLLGGNYEHILKNYSFIILKPELIYSNQYPKVFELLSNNCFDCIYFKKITLSNSQVLSLWNHSWKNASKERIFLNQKIFETFHSIVLVLKNVRSNFTDASEYITILKGKVYDTDDTISMRALLKPINYILSYVHTPDNIDCFIREMPIIFSWTDLVDIVVKIKHSQMTEINYYQVDISDKYIDFSSINTQKLLKEFVKTISKELPSNENSTIKTLNDIAKLERKFDLEIILTLAEKRLIKWNWETFIVLTTYIEYYK